jgi:hypothetical protein
VARTLQKVTFSKSAFRRIFSAIIRNLSTFLRSDQTLPQIGFAPKLHGCPIQNTSKRACKSRGVCESTILGDLPDLKIRTLNQFRGLGDTQKIDPVFERGARFLPKVFGKVDCAEPRNVGRIG